MSIEIEKAFEYINKYSKILWLDMIEDFLNNGKDLFWLILWKIKISIYLYYNRDYNCLIHFSNSINAINNLFKLYYHDNNKYQSNIIPWNDS